MRRPLPGHCVTGSTQGEPFQAFVPAPLPPVPPLDWSPAQRSRFDDALLALGRLDAVSALLPNAELLLYSFLRKEAVLSSLADLWLFEIDEQPGVPIDDTLADGLDAFERFLHDLPEATPTLVKAGWRMCSSRPSTLFWTAMAASAAC